MATQGQNAGVGLLADSQLWRGIIFPVVLAVGAVALAVLAAAFTSQTGEAAA